MPIIGNFPSGGGGGTGGLTLAAVTSIQTLAAAGKVYVKWTDPDDLVVDGSTLAAWGGTLLVRKAGSAPVSRRDGTVVLDSKTRNAYQSEYFCDSGLTNGVTYYYKFFPYTTQGSYTDSADDEFNITPIPVAVGDVSGMSAVAAGNGKLALKWTDPDATVVNDGATLATWANTVVVVKAGSYATDPDDEDAAYRLVVTTRNQYATSPLTATGLTNGTIYYVTFFPVSTDGAVNTNTVNRITGVPNRLTISTVPSQSGSLTYNGSSQSPSWSNYDTSKMTIGNQTAGTNAGNYTAQFTPTDDYCWSDGTTTAKNVTWTIGKAAGSLSLSATSVVLNHSAKSQTVTVTRAGDGAISAQTSDASVATVSVSGNVVTIQSVNDKTGTATITISVAAGTNYTAPGSKTVAVSAEFLPAVGTALNDCSWEDVSKIAAAGLASTYWSVGDTKTVTINGTVGTLSLSNLSVDVFILGFDHNSTYEGSNKIHFQIGKIDSALVGLIDSKYNSVDSDGTKYFNMNHWGGNNSGGWAGCDLRYDILGSTNIAPSGYGSAVTASRTGYDASDICATSPISGTLMAALPSDLRAVMKGVRKYADARGGSVDSSGAIEGHIDYLFLLAEFEVYGTQISANQYEQLYQKQYDYYETGNSKVLYRHSAPGSTAAQWWLRSSFNNGASFCITQTDGSLYRSAATTSRALTPGFVV